MGYHVVEVCRGLVGPGKLGTGSRKNCRHGAKKNWGHAGRKIPDTGSRKIADTGSRKIGGTGSRNNCGYGAKKKIGGTGPRSIGGTGPGKLWARGQDKIVACAQRIMRAHFIVANYMCTYICMFRCIYFVCVVTNCSVLLSFVFMTMYWDYVAIVLGCCEWVCECASKYKHNRNGVHVFLQ